MGSDTETLHRLLMTMRIPFVRSIVVVCSNAVIPDKLFSLCKAYHHTTLPLFNLHSTIRFVRGADNDSVGNT